MAMHATIMEAIKIGVFYVVRAEALYEGPTGQHPCFIEEDVRIRGTQICIRE
jgi:hypothetical protein